MSADEGTLHLFYSTSGDTLLVYLPTEITFSTKSQVLHDYCCANAYDVVHLQTMHALTD